MSLPITMKSGALLLGVAGTAAGLNLSVMSIGSIAGAPTEQTVAANETGEPEVTQVVVDVPLPTEDTIPSVLAAVAADGPSAPQTAAPATQAATSLTATATALPGAPASAAATTPGAPLSTVAPPRTAPTTATPTTVTPTTVTPTTRPPTSRPVTEYLTYTFEGVADIVVAYHDRQTLEFWSATPQPGWAFVVEKNTATQIELKFRRISGGEGEATFLLTRVNGELKVRTER